MARKDTFNNIDNQDSANVVLNRFSNFKIDEEPMGIPSDNKSDSKSTDETNEKKIEQHIQDTSSEVEETPVSPTPQINKQVSPTPKEPEVDVTDEYISEVRPPVFFKKKKESVQRSWKAWSDVDDALNDIFRDKKGRLKPGAKGEITNLMNNAVLAELVRIGYFPEEKLNDRVDYEGW